MRRYWVALITVIAVLLAGSAWLYVRDGDSFLTVSHPSSSASTKQRATVTANAQGTAVSFAGSASAAELPCAIRKQDVQKVLDYLAAKGEKSRADLAAVCRYYGVAAISVTSS